MREDGEARLETSRSVLGRHYKAEFEKLAITIDSLKAKHSRELDTFENEVYRL
jgi:hypothetical protein